MKLNRRKYMLMDEKVHYKMYKSGKSWVVAGITAFGLCLAVGLPTASVNAATKASEVKLTAKSNANQNAELMRQFSGNPLLKDSGLTLAQQYTQLTTANSAPVFGKIITGKDTYLRYFYGDGTTAPLASIYASDATGQITGGGSVSLYGALPNFNVINKTTGQVLSNALYDSGRRRGRIKIGINNDMQTLAGPIQGSQRLYYIGTEPSKNNDPSDPELNQNLIVKYSSDYLIKGKTYTMDYTQTFKPNGSYVNYTISARNVTGLASGNQNDPANDLPGLFFESDFDTYFMDQGDSAPMYYIANNAGLFSRGKGPDGNTYRLNYYFNTPTSPTGWVSPGNAYDDAKRLFPTPDSLGSKVPKGQAPHKDGEYATTTPVSDPGLFMVWKGQDLKVGESRELSYQTGMINENAETAVIKLDKESERYTGKNDYTVTGKVSDKDTTALPLKYYYSIDGGTEIEFTGPVLTDNTEKPFSFVIPKDKLTVGDTHQIAVFTVDQYGQTSPNQYMQLTAEANLDVKDVNHFVGDTFDKYEGLIGGEEVNGDPIKNTSVDVTITGPDGKVVDAADVTKNPGKYTITYSYTYGNDSTKITKQSTVNIYAPNDPTHGADFTVKPSKTYYKDDKFNPEDLFVSGWKHDSTGAKVDLEFKDLTHVNNTVPNSSLNPTDDDLTKNTGSYEVVYNYPYGNNGQVSSQKTNISIVDRKYITLKYVDQKGNEIDPKFLTDLKDNLTSGQHSLPYGSDFTVTPVNALSLNGKEVYTLDHFEVDGVKQNAASSKLTFGDNDQVVKVVYNGSAANNITVEFVDVDHPEKPVSSDNPAGNIGEELDLGKNGAGVAKLPNGYHYADASELKPGQKQPQANPTFDTDAKKETVYVVGDVIAPGATNGLIVHHMMKDKNGNDVPVPTMKDIQMGGRVGQTIKVKPTEAAAGYTLDPTAKATDYTFAPNTSTSTPGEITFYYTANQYDNIHISFTDVTNKKEVKPVYTPTGNHTGDSLDLSSPKDNPNSDLAGHLPDGYHVATGAELVGEDGTTAKQPANPTYTSEDQYPSIWVIGNDISENDANALTIHHMMKDKNGNDVPVPTMKDIKKGGRVGQTINVKPTPAADGYSTDPVSKAVDYTFDPKKPGEITFYYTADIQDNIKVDFQDVNNSNVSVGSEVPKGNHTGDTLDLSTVKLPDGYHVATDDELVGKTGSDGNQLKQPDNPVYKPGSTIVPVPVYVVGNDIAEGDVNALTIHHYLKDKTDKDGNPVKVPGMEDIKKGGKVGETISIQPTPAAPGYDFVSQSDTSYKFDPKKPGTVNLYYKPSSLSNITVDFVNINGSGKDVVGTGTPTLHFTGDELDLSNDPEIKSAVPNGYQLASDDELKAKGLTRPQNPTYGPQAPKENPIVYVVGKETTASNALTVHHKIKGPNNTETNVPGMSDITMNGRVGETIKVQPTAPIAGYTLASESKETAYKFKPDSTGDITFYYTAKEQSNVTINFVNAKNGKTVKTDSPKGKTGDTLDLTSVGPDSYIKKTIPAGYHYATNGELNGNSQPDKNLEFSTTPQTQTVYVAGDVVDGTSHASSRVTIHHYLKGTATPVPGMGEVGTGNSYKGGIIGDNVTVSPDDPEQKAPAGYTIVPNQQPDTWELTADGGHEVTYYYTADSIDNISIQFVNASDPTKKVGMPYIPSGHVTGDNLKVDSDEVKGHVPAGYHVASKAELDDLGSSLTQPELVYGVTSGVQTVYVIGEAQSNITVHFLDAKTLKELGTVTPKENPDSNSNPKASYRTGDVLKLDAASNYVSDFINAHTGYSYTSNSELSSMNLKQPENPTYTTQSQDINVYLSPQSKATHILKVIHKEQLPSTRGVRGLKDFQTSIEEGSDYDFDINDSAHKAPRGYTLIPGQESKLKGTMGTDGKEIILYYAKIR
ncbi:KxYKxGKxW signal peptide domain-containing protein [Xylocopilactobacillus apicola]|uniref:MucBP domain-containing protein n=1 Tax=Xylocopilactobacillus apicola TaxID=2932184 RepID=A0AAU9DU31_9LACO|nr:KxYKxGKxW signal peptide domain-containing protein [Xylocopilactobacillus apicola]BDR59704.1 hypothetical protein XA3_21450 [Xylocopilactobacillus apicola]